MKELILKENYKIKLAPTRAKMRNQPTSSF
jgi:hypothetical protein